MSRNITFHISTINKNKHYDILIAFWIAHIGSSVCICAQLLSPVQLFETPWTVACQAPLSMEFSRQEYWSGLQFPSPGGLPNPGTEPRSLVFPALAGGFFTTSTIWEGDVKIK